MKATELAVEVLRQILFLFCFLLREVMSDDLEIPLDVLIARDKKKRNQQKPKKSPQKPQNNKPKQRQSPVRVFYTSIIVYQILIYYMTENPINKRTNSR